MAKKTFYVVSDIHGHATEFEKELEKSGFTKNGEDTLICLGDCFDRGCENIKVKQILDSIENKIMIKGNHEDMLEDVIKERFVTYVDIHNGTDITLENFFGIGCIDPLGKLKTDIETEKQILDFTSKMIPYYETKNYIFVHGYLPLKMDKLEYVYDENWREADEEGWRRARFYSWYQMHPKKLNGTNKVIVCGHSSCSYASKIDSSRKPSDFSPYYQKDLIAIDGNTYISGRVNIIKIEDEVI